MATDSRVSAVPAPLMAICGWLLPGAGYFLIGQIGRALGIGITIILLFVAGLLIGGVREIEVPGFNVDTGEKQMVTLVDPVTHRALLDSQNRPQTGWALEVSALGEIRDKPWSVPQVLAGPIAIASGVWSVHNAAADGQTMQIDPATGKLDVKTGKAPLGAISHARVNEIGSLYLSVAGLLNLMAIIDSTWRASHLSQKRKEAK